MTTPITIGHPSFSAFKPYLRPANHTFMSTDNPASATTERFVLPVERAPTNVNTASRRRQRTTFTPAQADTLEKARISVLFDSCPLHEFRLFTSIFATKLSGRIFSMKRQSVHATAFIFGGQRQSVHVTAFIFGGQQALLQVKEYLTDQYMPRTRRILIAESLGLNEGQVKTWFQNRRAKEKRNDKNSVATNIQRLLSHSWHDILLVAKSAFERLYLLSIFRQ
ncbi:unnamed protein product [Toxocara canis]|uniref:Homeobox domain-containing protein n=1 Tax=Toxocara canis TaxID=6265 RepID=A0A183UDG5_TOXCA|nr:unnamed protein product [Toxocara canis]